MKKAVVLVVVAIVGLGAGLAAGIMVTNSKSKAAIADMETKMQRAETASQEKISGYNAIIERLNGELQIAKMEIETLKTPAPAEAPAEQTSVAAVTTENTAAAPADNSITENTKLYTIKSGDSLWSIAQKQLGNGSRFKEILKLNPKISAKGNLVVGSKLKMPAK
jgi:nucleoid-associated protein YgaU